MGNVKSKPKRKELLGIEKLMSNLDLVTQETKRLPRDVVVALLGQFANEIPYVSQILPNSFAEILLSDAPQLSTQLVLNELIVNLGKALCDSNQKDNIASLVQTYRHERKKSEIEYAVSIVDEVIKDTTFASLPERAQPGLKELAQTILEKIISEKQLRKVPGYRLHPLIEIIESFLYQRNPNIEIEKAKVTHSLVFRKFVNSVAQNGYEIITDEKKLTAIQKEKDAAFTIFKNAIATKVPSAAHIKKFNEIMRFLQSDQNQKYSQLKITLNDLFKSFDSYLAQSLMIRFNDKLRRTFRLLELSPEIYISEEVIKTIHVSALAEAEEDANSVKNLILVVYTIQENFNSQFLHRILGKKHLATVNDALLDVLLGKNTLKIDHVTTQARSIRAGGYPVKNIIEIYTAMINSLKKLSEQLSGIYADDLKVEITKAIEQLVAASKDLRIITHATAIYRPVEAVVAPPPTFETSEAMLKSLVESGSRASVMPPVKTEAPSLLDEQFDLEPPVEVQAQSPEKVKSIEEKPAPIAESEPQLKEEPKEEPVQVASTESQSKTEPEPLQIDETFEEEPASAAVTEPQPKTEPAPLQIDETFEEEPAPTAVVESQPKVEPKPLLIDELFEDEPVPTAAAEPQSLLVAESFKDETVVGQAIIDAGLRIMKNYKLGDLEQPILAGWKTMVSQSGESAADIGAGSDVEVRLYVLCDLAQQVASVQEETLPSELQIALQSIKTQLVKALQNPLDEKNWDCFEGSQRDFIDGTLAALLS